MARSTGEYWGGAFEKKEHLEFLNGKAVMTPELVHSKNRLDCADGLLG